jgi:acyl-coenzyme A synthetase/AMP-(fatty) acid ligase
VFGTLPKTSTGKIQKFVLRDRARAARPPRRKLTAWTLPRLL